MAYLKTYTKAPPDKRSFDIPFDKLFAVDAGLGGLKGDTIASFLADCSAGIAIVDSSTVGNAVRLWLIGGENGRYYTATADITTTAGRKVHGAIRIRVAGTGIPAALPIDAGDVGDLTDLTPIDGGEA